MATTLPELAAGFCVSLEQMKIALALLATCVTILGRSTGSPVHSARTTLGDTSIGLVTTGPPSARGGRVHLTGYTDNDSATSSVILTGAVGDFGSGTLNQRTGKFVLQLSRGSFSIQFADLDAKFLAVLRRLPVNQSTCSASAQVSGTAPIVVGTGTGSYTQITGAFSLTLTLDEVFHGDACNELSPFTAQKIVTSGWGAIQTTETHHDNSLIQRDGALNMKELNQWSST
jgi:hypothetical protein